MSDDLARLRRWEDAGAHWTVLARRPDLLILSLQTCDTHEEVDRLASAEPDLIGHVGDRDSAEDPVK
jgi:hypothetical protein